LRLVALRRKALSQFFTKFDSSGKSLAQCQHPQNRKARAGNDRGLFCFLKWNDGLMRLHKKS